MHLWQYSFIISHKAFIERSNGMRALEISDDESFANIVPLFETNILPYGKLYLPSGAELVCFTRTRRRFDSSPQDRLFVDDIWPGSRVLADFLISVAHTVVGKICLEFGAGGALPSVVAASVGATRTIITDFPADNVIENIVAVITANRLHGAIAIGHIWGRENTEPLLDLGYINDSGEREGYDIVLLAELLWKDTYQHHSKLLQSLSSCLNRKNGIAYMTFAHRPTQDSLDHTPDKDLEFFALAASDFGLESTLIQVVSKYHDVDEISFIDVYLYSLQFRSSV